MLEFKDRKRKLMQPGLYTELFFLDEATALAGGHRPCYECRRATALAFRDALDAGGIVPATEKVGAIDAHIAGETQKVLKDNAPRETVNPATLPFGAMYVANDEAYLKLGSSAQRWTFEGYDAPIPLHASAQRLTPRATCAALHAGYKPLLHSSAQTPTGYQTS